jgi:hypothetical protein
MAEKKRRVVTRVIDGKVRKDVRAAPKRAGSTGKPSAAGRYSTQLKKAP